MSDCELPGLELHRKIPPQLWCVNRDDLISFEADVRKWHADEKIPQNATFENPFHDHPQIGPRMYQVTECFIKPVTRDAGGMSYALMLHPEGLKCDLFVTHAWAEGVYEFCDKVKRAWPLGARNLWCCFLANPQNGDIGTLIGGNVLQSPFARAIYAAQHMIVCPNHTVSIYERLWCVLEAKLAIESNLTLRLPAVPPRVVAKTFLTAALCSGLAAFISWSAFHRQDRFDAACVFSWISMVALVVGSIYVICVGQILRARFHANHNIFIGARMVLFGTLGGFVLGKWSLLLTMERHGAHITRKTSTEWEIVLWSKIMAGLGRSVLVAVGLTSIENVVRRGWKDAVLEEACLLDFETVSDAKCFSSDDADRLWSVMSGHEETIDMTINVLRAAGSYDDSVRADLEYGFDPQHGRQIKLGRAAIVCLLWGVCSGVNPGNLYPATPLGYWHFFHPWKSFFVAAMLPALVAICTERDKLYSRRVAYAFRAMWWGVWFLLTTFALTSAAAMSSVDFLTTLDHMQRTFFGTKKLIVQMMCEHLCWTYIAVFLVSASRALVGPEGLRYFWGTCRSKRIVAVLAVSLCVVILVSAGLLHWSLPNYSECVAACGQSDEGVWECTFSWTAKLCVAFGGIGFLSRWLGRELFNVRMSFHTRPDIGPVDIEMTDMCKDNYGLPSSPKKLISMWQQKGYSPPGSPKKPVCVWRQDSPPGSPRKPISLWKSYSPPGSPKTPVAFWREKGKTTRSSKSEIGSAQPSASSITDRRVSSMEGRKQESSGETQVLSFASVASSFNILSRRSMTQVSTVVSAIDLPSRLQLPTWRELVYSLRWKAAFIFALGLCSAVAFAYRPITGQEIGRIEGLMEYAPLAVLSPDSRRLFSIAKTGSASLWDFCRTQVVDLENTTVISAAFSPDGHTVAIGTKEGIVWLWTPGESSDDKILVKLAELGDEAVTRLQFMHHGSVLYLTSRFPGDEVLAGFIRLLSMQSGKLIKTITVPCFFPDRPVSYYFDAQLSPDTQTTYISCADNASVWNIVTGELLKQIPKTYNVLGNAFGLEYHDSFTGAAFNGDGSLLLYIEADKTIVVWNVTSRAEIFRLGWNERFDVTSAAFCTHDNLLITGTTKGWVVVWNITAGIKSQMLYGHTHDVTTVTCSPRGLVLTTSVDRTARLYDLVEDRAYAVLRGHTKRVTRGYFASSYQRVVTVSKDETARFWYASQIVQFSPMMGHITPITIAAFNFDGSLVVTASLDGTFHVWSASDGTHLHALRGHTACVSSALFSLDGKLLASGSSDGTVRIWNMSTGTLIRSFLVVGAQQWGRDIIIKFLSNDGRSLVALCLSETWLFNVETGEKIRRDMACWGVAVSPIGDRLVGCVPRALVMWNITSWEELLRVEELPMTAEDYTPEGVPAPPASASFIEFSPDGTKFLVMVMGRYQNVWLFDAQSGAVLYHHHVDDCQHIFGVRNYGNGHSFSSDGTVYMVTSYGGIHLFSSTNGQLLKFFPGRFQAFSLSPLADSLLTATWADGKDRNLAEWARVPAQIWDVASGASEILPHSDQVGTLTFSHDGKYFVTGSHDSSAIVWRTADRKKCIQLGFSNRHWLRPPPAC